jgi:hypothetical protein
MSYIRKLAVGINYPDGAIHYQVGKEVIYNKSEGRKTHEITHILEDMDQSGLLVYNIYIANIEPENGVRSEVLWKSVPKGMYTYPEFGITSE